MKEMTLSFPALQPSITFKNNRKFNLFIQLVMFFSLTSSFVSPAKAAPRPLNRNSSSKQTKLSATRKRSNTAAKAPNQLSQNKASASTTTIPQFSDPTRTPASTLTPQEAAQKYARSKEQVPENLKGLF